MIKLISFISEDGDVVWIVPEHVTHIMWAHHVGKERVECSTINFIGGGHVTVRGNVNDVVHKVTSGNKL